MILPYDKLQLANDKLQLLEYKLQLLKYKLQLPDNKLSYFTMKLVSSFQSYNKLYLKNSKANFLSIEFYILIFK
jgi:hypothetical protein